ncbi:hypothetical protein AVEN_218707-1 [Araneus ventricosus]|uniref:Uncharacterized protein n=1 Tax=Araneus ventricosus TaxID=182803 RepID=A0A4Y2B5B1_ARAVE|nr:hypothetical protein AVEN_218707-1 [Araneus ventricosus]
MSREFGKLPNLGVAAKVRINSGLSIRADHTALCRRFRSLRPSSSLLNGSSLHSSFSIQHSVFIPYLKGWSSAFLPLYWPIVLPGDQRLTLFPVVKIQPWVKVLGFCHHRAI